MPTIGDLIAKWANGRNALLRGEVEELRLKLNRIEAAASRLDTLSAPTMGLDPNIFRNSGGFSVLPHNHASIGHGETHTYTSIPANTWTAMPIEPGWVHTYSQGYQIDTTNGRVYVTGVPHDTVLDILVWFECGSAAGGEIGVKWLADDGSQRVQTHTVTAKCTSVFVHHRRKTKIEHAYYSAQIYHNKAGGLTTGTYACMDVLQGR